MKYDVIDSKTVFEGHIMKVRVDDVKSENGEECTREVVEHCEAVAVLAFDDERNIFLVRQWRHPLLKEFLEIPAGCVEPDENPDETVVRELQEEIGYKPMKIKKLGGYYSAPGFSNEYLHVYVASDLIESKLQAEDTNEIEIIKVPYDEFANMIRRREIEDSKALIALTMCQNRMVI